MPISKIPTAKLLTRVPGNSSQWNAAIDGIPIIAHDSGGIFADLNEGDDLDALVMLSNSRWVIIQVSFTEK